MKDDLLYRGSELVGVPATEEAPRYFFYRIEKFRRREAERELLENYCGCPATCYEINGVLLANDHLDKMLPGTDLRDEDALRFVRSWVKHHGNTGDDTDSICRDRSSIVSHGSRERTLSVALAKVRQGPGEVEYSVTRIARFVGSTIVEVAAMTGRSQPIAWAKDAVLISLSRERGTGALSDKFRIRRFGRILGASEPFDPQAVKQIKPTPILAQKMVG